MGIGTGQSPQPEALPHEAAPLLDSPDPLEIAMDAVNAGAGPDSPAAELLATQCQLLREDIRHRRLQIRSERMLIGLRSLLAFATVLVVSGAVAMAWRASHSKGLVVESFHVPPSLAAQGLTGEVVASKIIDRLTDMRGKTQSTRAVDTLEGDWRNQYRVEIPQTGIAIGDIRRALRQWLGNDTHIGGDVFRVGSQIGLTVRTDKGPSATFEGTETELDVLAQQAAEDVYANTSPYLYGIYLRLSGREAQGIAALQRLAEGGPNDEERAWGYNGWGQALRSHGLCSEAIPVFQEAIRLYPNLRNAFSGLTAAQECLGHDQLALVTRRRMLKIESGEDQKPVARERQVQQVLISVAMMTGDFNGAHTMQLALHNPETNAVANQLILAGMMARAHDTGGATRTLNRAHGQPIERDRRPYYWYSRLLQYFRQEAWQSVVLTADRESASVNLVQEGRGNFQAFERVRIQPLVAISLARSGDIRAARSLVATTPIDCYPCIRARAQVAEIAGDRREADRWFAEAVRQGPRLPFAYSEWGESKLARGDLPGAIALFARSTEHGPRFADPLKFWGDTLARQGKDRDAVLKYSASADRAPRWGELYLDWGLALQRLGRHDEARKKLALASKLDLPADDRPRLQQALKKTRR